MSIVLLYTKIQVDVQRELYEAVDMQYFDALKAIIESPQWIYQDRPIPRGMLRSLCPRTPDIDRCVCAFCPDVSFSQVGHALEHIQQHFGLRPFQCTAPDW